MRNKSQRKDEKYGHRKFILTGTGPGKTRPETQEVTRYPARSWRSGCQISAKLQLIAGCAANFRDLVLFCIEADFCTQICIFQHFSSSTTVPDFSGKILLNFVENQLTFQQNFATLQKFINFERFLNFSSNFQMRSWLYL